MPPRVFVSHSSQDVELVEVLVDLLERAFPFETEDIRCTSLPGYGLESGAHTSVTLRQEVEAAEVILGVLSHSGRHSDWVLFELGAAWGMGKRVIPMLYGLAYSDLPGPLGEQHVVNAAKRPDVLQMLETLQKTLGVTHKPVSRFDKAVGKLVALATQKGASPVSLTEPPPAQEPEEPGRDVEDTIEPTNKPVPKSVSIKDLGNTARVTVTWAYEQGKIPADRFVVFWAYGRQPTHTDESTIVPHTSSRSFSRILGPGEQCFFGIAAARGEKIGPVVTSTSIPNWDVVV